MNLYEGKLQAPHPRLRRLRHFGAHVVVVNLLVYAQQVAIGLAMIRLLIAVYDFAEIIAKPVFGFIADRKGMKIGQTSVIRNSNQSK